jgi:hypothetical protein
LMFQSQPLEHRLWTQVAPGHGMPPWIIGMA